MVLIQKSVCAVALISNGVKSGLKTGMKLSTAVIDVVRINETHNLYSF